MPPDLWDAWHRGQKNPAWPALAGDLLACRNRGSSDGVQAKPHSPLPPVLKIASISSSVLPLVSCAVHTRAAASSARSATLEGHLIY